MDDEHDERALAARLAARFAKLHPDTARRLKMRAEVYRHRPLTDAWPIRILRAQLSGVLPDDLDRPERTFRVV